MAINSIKAPNKAMKNRPQKLGLDSLTLASDCGVEAVEKARSRKTIVPCVKFIGSSMVKPIQISRSVAFLRSNLAGFVVKFKAEDFSTPSLGPQIQKTYGITETNK